MSQKAQNHLFLAHEYAKQLAVHLERALQADLYRDEPLMSARLRKVAQEANELAIRVEDSGVSYNELNA